MIVTEWKSQFPAHFEARTLLNPFFRLYHSVTVQVRTEVSDTREMRHRSESVSGVDDDSGAQSVVGVRVPVGTPPDIKTALIADAYRVRIIGPWHAPRQVPKHGY